MNCCSVPRFASAYRFAPATIAAGSSFILSTARCHDLRAAGFAVRRGYSRQKSSKVTVIRQFSVMISGYSCVPKPTNRVALKIAMPARRALFTRL